MDHVDFIFAANAVVWLGIGGYLAFLALGQRRLAQRCQHLELLSHEQENEKD